MSADVAPVVSESAKRRARRKRAKQRAAEAAILPPAVSWHAAERYADRVRPGMSVQDAKEEITRLLEFTQPGEPQWARTDPSCTYLLLNDDLAFVVSPENVIVTCLVRTMMAPEIRERRNERRASRTWAKRARSRSGRRPPR